MRLEPQTDLPEERFAPGAVLHVEGRESPLTVVDASRDGPGWRVRFAEITDRTAAETLRGLFLEVPVERTERLGRGEYYWHELVGVSVVDPDGRPLGTVTEVYRAGGAEVIVVDAGGRTFDVALVKAVVRTMAPRRGRIVIDPAAAGLSLEQPAPRARPPRRARPAPGSGDADEGPAR